MSKRFLWVFPVMALFLFGCGVNFNLPNITSGSGKVTSESRTVSGFDQVMLAGSGDLSITQGDKESLTIEAEDNILPLLTSDVINHQLVLGTKTGMSINPTKTIHYTLTVKDLTSVDLAGSGNIQSGALKSTTFSVGLAGSGNIGLDSLTADALKVTIAGSGSVNVAGKVTDLNVSLPGSGQFTGKDLQCETASIHILGSGNATVWASKTLDVNITGSGNVGYYGQPAVSEHITGSGSVNQLSNR